VATAAEFHGVSGNAGDVLPIAAPQSRPDLPARLILLGVGDESAASMRRAGAALARATMGAGSIRSTVADSLPLATQTAFIEGFLLGGYRTMAAKDRGPGIAAAMELTGVDGRSVSRAHAAAAASWLARDLTNAPPHFKNPVWLAEQAVRIAHDAGLDVRVLDELQLAADGFGGILAVGSGSASPPRLVEISYTPAGDAAAKHVVLVGKGITFDTGGLSLKKTESMVAMKTDMAGAAAALAAVAGAARTGVPHKVTALLALAENSISGSAYRPGDVVRSFGGTTIEIGNTDAEGRMVLADALSYAVQNLRPDALIDIATLTGAAAQGLGMRHAALFSNDDALVRELNEAAAETGECLWRMPLAEAAGEYRPALDSDVADISQIAAGKPHPGGGAITAALFLREFAGAGPWAHLDIAGPARYAADEHEVTKGASGFGARLLLAYLAR
jgi:leucyl aminopeptidase